MPSHFQSQVLLQDKFIDTLFGLFVLQHFDYCSSVYFGNVSKAVSLQMEKCFNKASKQVLNVRSNGLDLGGQLSKLSLFDILPWKARMIKHFCSFSYSLLGQNRASQLLSCLTKVEGRSSRYQRG